MDKQVYYVSSMLHRELSAELTNGSGANLRIALPSGCVGVLFVYDSVESMLKNEDGPRYFCIQELGDEQQCQQNQKSSADGSHSSTQ